MEDSRQPFLFQKIINKIVQLVENHIIMHNMQIMHNMHSTYIQTNRSFSFTFNDDFNASAAEGRIKISPTIAAGLV